MKRSASLPMGTGSSNSPLWAAILWRFAQAYLDRRFSEGISLGDAEHLINNKSHTLLIFIIIFHLMVVAAGQLGSFGNWAIL